MKMNRIAAAALAGTMLTAPVLAEDAAWTPPTVTQEEMDDCRSGLLSGMDALEDSLSALEGWYYGQILRGEPLYPPAYGKVLTSAVTIDEVRRVLEQYSYSVGYVVTARPGTEGKGTPDEE